MCFTAGFDGALCCCFVKILDWIVGAIVVSGLMVVVVVAAGFFVVCVERKLGLIIGRNCSALIICNPATVI